MDTFIEQIIQKRKGGKEYAIIFGVIVLGLLLIVACWLFLPMLTIFVLAGVGFGGWYLITEQSKEFEYSVTNGSIDVDMIIARRRRKRVVSVSGSKLEALLPYDPSHPVNAAAYQRVVMAAPSDREEGLWYFTYHSKKNGHTMVIFQPEQRVLQALYSGLNKLVQMDTARAAREQGILLGNSYRSHGTDE